ncbi:MAG: class I SAM-dependent methyltransferase [Thermoplasmata archaeon]|nr:class I SAM-dependent methyltransferase [Thermoplasmata archaeon]
MRPPRTVRWPAPLPGRPGWAWLLGTRLRRWRVRRIFRLLIPQLAPGSIVVDVGCGPGYTDDELLRSVGQGAIARLVMLDPQSGMVEQAERRRAKAQERYHPAGVVLGDAAALPIREGSADAVLSLGVLCCMEDEFVDRAVLESYRVLRPGGLFLLGVPRRRGPSDEARLTGAGFVRNVGYRAGLSLFRKPF